jgi:ATP-dependent 26S proteasome regulatory subunit
MHEATRKLLGVLLREMDGFDAGKKSIVIGATNRRADLVLCFAPAVFLQE